MRYAGLFIVSAVALSAATYVLLARALAAQDHDVLQSMLSRYAVEYQRSGLPGLQRVIEADAGQGRHEGLLVRVVDERTEAVYFAAPLGWGEFDLSPLDAPSVSASGWATLSGLPDGAVLEVGSVTLPYRVMVQVGRSSHVRDELLGRFRARGIEILALIAVAAVAGGFLLTRAALAPLRALEGTVRSILQTGQFDASVPIRNSHDPLDELGARVNEMLERIQSLIGGMRGAIDNVAHDLRTPLTRFRNVAEAALLANDPERAREGLAQALEEADRVNATLTALMDISQAETGTMALVLQPVRLGQVVNEAVALYADEAEDRSISLSSAVPDDLRVDADHTRLRQVLAEPDRERGEVHRRWWPHRHQRRRQRRIRHAERERHRHRHRRGAPATRVGPAVSRRRQPHDAGLGVGIVAGQGRGRGPRWPSGGDVSASAGQHVHGDPPHRGSSRHQGTATQFSVIGTGPNSSDTGHRTPGTGSLTCHSCHLPDTLPQAAPPSNHVRTTT